MTRRAFTVEDMRAFEPDAKIGLLATRDAAGLPHVTLITSLMARGPLELMFGQFSEGQSKRNLREDPRAAFLVMNAERRLWRGKARWTRAATEGEDFVAYNRRPMFRYNAYFGIHTVHYLDVVAYAGGESLSVPALAVGLAAATVARRVVGRAGGERALTVWAEGHLARPMTIKFAAWIGEDGYPWIEPGVACLPVDGRRLVVASRAVPAGRPVALFGVNLETESVLVRGVVRRRVPGVGVMDVDWVYNSMPPKQGVVYPRPEVRAVEVFE